MADIIKPDSDKVGVISPAEAATIKSFIRAFGGQWFTKMSGPLTVPFTIAAFFVPTAWAKISFAILAAICASVSSYTIWAKERQSCITIRRELEIEREKNAKPELKAEANIFYLAQNGPFSEGNPYAWRFVLDVAVVNLRPASTSLRGARLTITSQAGGHVATLEQTVPIERGFRLHIADGTPTGKLLAFIDLPYLMDRVEGKKLERGQHVSGWLGFQLSPCTLRAREMHYDLALIDGYGSSHPVSFGSVACEDAYYIVSDSL